MKLAHAQGILPMPSGSWQVDLKNLKRPFINSRLSRCSTDRGAISRLPQGGRTKVKVQGSLKVENKEHLFDFVVTL